MPTTEELLTQVAYSLEGEKIKLEAIRENLERCEKASSISSARLLNLPTKVGKALEH